MGGWHWRDWFSRKELSLGERGELYAAKWLKRRGYRILTRGYRTQLGEIDLVAMHRKVLVFVEVKTRQSDTRGEPVEWVGYHKQQRLVRAALEYMKSHRLLETACRFDVVSIVWPKGATKPQIKHFDHAFDAVGHSSMFS